MDIKRVMVVDDSCMYQRLLSDIINVHPAMQVVGVATNGKAARLQGCKAACCMPPVN